MLRRRLKHHEDQAHYLRTVMAAYERSSAETDDEVGEDHGDESVLSPEAVRG